MTRTSAAAVAVLVAAVAFADSGLPPYFEFSPDQETAVDEALTPQEQGRLGAALRERDRLDATTWQSERLAQLHERVFVALWDALRAARDPLAAARAFPVPSITLPVPGPARTLKDGLRLSKPGPATGAALDGAGWQRRLAAWHAAGWRLAQTEWHHDEFHPEAMPPWSYMKTDLQLIAPDGGRHEFRGRLKITWREPARAGDLPEVAAVDATALDWLRRPQAPAFRPVLTQTFDRVRDQGSTMLLAWDLAGQGRSDLILPGVNARFRNLGGFRFRREPFLAHPVFPDPCGVLADFDGDGRTDYLCTAGTPQRLLLYRGGAGGTFPDAAVAATDDPLDLKAGSVMTVGDVNGDGLPDVWIGQYRNPYMGGLFPAPYYDANDGYPCYLLLGDGHGRFRDGTAAAGFDAKRNRRNYCAALLDLFGDGRLDLITVNDFAGVDLWRNTGHGRFVDATAQALDDPMNFGMGLAVDDFAHDGHPGFYVSGMGSTTMRRLAKMGLRPAAGMDVTMTRTRMGYGNRLYLWSGPGTYREPAWNDQVGRSGWSWGTVGFDPDLDGDRDLYVLNGFISGRSTVDYCTTFWCHDVYTPRDEDPKLVRHLLAASTIDLNRGEASWNGYEKKRFFLHAGATEFIEAAWPLGLALEQDCRNLVADDLDGDGRPDLALLYEDRRADSNGGTTGAGRFGLMVLQNGLATRHHWLGVRLGSAGPTLPFGAVITLHTADGPRVAVVVAGDSWRSQQAACRHFGLGDARAVESLEVRWPGGKVSRVDHPAIDRYHTIVPPP